MRRRTKQTLLIVAAIAGFLSITLQNCRIIKQNEDIKANLELIQYQQDRQRAAIDKLLTPMQKQQLRGEQILNSLNKID